MPAGTGRTLPVPLPGRLRPSSTIFVDHVAGDVAMGTVAVGLAMATTWVAVSGEPVHQPGGRATRCGVRTRRVPRETGPATDIRSARPATGHPQCPPRHRHPQWPPPPEEDPITSRQHGPLLHGDGTVTFRVWAPHAERVRLVLGDDEHQCNQGERGWWSLRVDAEHGSRYGYRLDDGDVLPDPASRHQPDGVHERSAVVDPRRWSWSNTERDWRARPLAGAVFYELHVGTFTSGGTFTAAVERLDGLAELGVTHVEVMPVAAFNGTRGWGYDGVAWYAVHEPYGGPEGFAGFVDACHQRGLAVVVDAVYNHLGPSGNYLPEYGPYLTERYDTPWGAAINLDGPGSDAVRAFIAGSALGWFADYHVDGLRLDAVHGLVDMSAVHVLAQLAQATRELSHRLGRPLQLVAESDRQDPQTVRPAEVGGVGLDGQWLDDLHHAVHTAVTGEHEGYYADYAGLRDVAAAYTRGFVYDGRYSPARERTVGAPATGVPSHRFVACIQNHDQVGNRAAGDRLTTIVDADLARVAIVLLLAAPTTPMLFMGEEYGETNPFCYFTSHPEPELAEAVSEGRRREFASFASFGGHVPDPQDPGTFAASRLDWSKADSDAGRARRALWSDLLRLRREVPALSSGRRELTQVLHVDDRLLVVRRRHEQGPTIVVAANLADEPAEQTVNGAVDRVLLSTGEARYGGSGGAPDTGGARVTLPPRTACVLVEAPPG